MGDRQDVSNELSQDDLDRASVLLARDSSFDIHFENAHSALWPDYNEKFSKKTIELNKIIDWGMAHELSGTWWFMSPLYWWWYEIDVKDKQRYLLDIFIKLRANKLQYSRLSAGEQGVLGVFSSNSLAPFFQYTKSTFMGGEGFRAFCQLFSLIWSAVRVRVLNQPVLFNQGQKKMDTVVTILNIVSQQSLSYDQQQAFFKRIRKLENKFRGYHQLLVTQNSCFIPGFFLEVDSPFCVWQRLYLELKKEIEDLSNHHLSGVVFDGKSGVQQLKEIKEKLEETQQCALKYAEEFLRQKSEQMKADITHAYNNARIFEVCNVREFESFADSKIRKFNNAAMGIGADNIPVLNEFRKSGIKSLQECQARYMVQIEQPNRRENKGGGYVDKYSFDSFEHSYRSIRETLTQLRNHSTRKDKMILILSLMTQLINAVQEQAKISDPRDSRQDKHLFIWLGFNKQHNAVMELFRALETSYIEVYREAKAALDPSDIEVGTQDRNDGIINLPAQMKEHLNYLRTRVSFESNNADTKLAKDFFDLHAARLEDLEADTILCHEQIHVNEFIVALNIADETAWKSMISHIDENRHPSEVMEGIEKLHKTSLQTALEKLPEECRKRPDIQSKVKETISVFCQTFDHVNSWFMIYDNTLRYFDGDKEDFEKLRKELVFQYHPDTAKARKNWSDIEREIYSAIFNKLNIWIGLQNIEYEEAEILANALPALRGLVMSNADSIKKFVIAHKTHTMHQLRLWYRQHYSEAVLESQLVKILRDEAQKLREQTNSPNNDAIMVYEAPPQYPQESNYEIFLRFDKVISILLNRVNNQWNPRNKNNFPKEKKEELVSLMEGALADTERLQMCIEGILERKEFFIEREMQKQEEIIHGWKKELEGYEKLENTATVYWNQLNTFETYLDMFEFALDIVPRKCLYGYDTPRSERFLEGIGLEIRSASLVARFCTVTQTLPGESDTRLYNLKSVLKKFSSGPDSLYEGVVYCLKNMRYETSVSVKELKALVKKRLEEKSKSSSAKIRQRGTYDWKDEIFAIADILGICVEVENRTKFSTVHGNLDAPLVSLLQDANSDIYYALVPLEQYVGQFVSNKNTADQNQTPPSPSSLNSSANVDEETEDKHEQQSSMHFLYQNDQHDQKKVESSRIKIDI